MRFLSSQANEAKGFRLERTLTGHGGQVWSTVATADGVRAVSGGDDQTVRVWDLGAGKLERTIDGHVEIHNKVAAVAVTPDGTRIISGGHSRNILVESGHEYLHEGKGRHDSIVFDSMMGGPHDTVSVTTAVP